MPRRTHVEDTHRHSRAQVRAQRERMIAKRLRAAKTQIHSDAVVLNFDKASQAPLAGQLAGVPEVDDRRGPVVAVHPDAVRRAHPDDGGWLLWPFQWARGRFATHPFDRRHCGGRPDAETCRPGWRSRARQTWSREAQQEATEAL